MIHTGYEWLNYKLIKNDNLSMEKFECCKITSKIDFCTIINNLDNGKQEHGLLVRRSFIAAKSNIGEYDKSLIMPYKSRINTIDGDLCILYANNWYETKVSFNGGKFYNLSNNDALNRLFSAIFDVNEIKNLSDYKRNKIIKTLKNSPILANKQLKDKLISML